MRVLNNKFVRVSLIVCLILSMALTSAFAASYSVPYAEPPADDSNGYISLAFSSGNIMTYWWSTNASTTGTQQVFSYCDISISSTTINFTFGAYPPSSGSSFMYNLSRRTGTKLWLMGSGSSTSASGVSFSHNFSSLGTITAVTYAGNINVITGLTDTGSASITFNGSTSSDIYTKVNQIYIQMESVISQLNDSNISLNEVEDLLTELTDSIDLLHQKNVFWLEAIWNRLERTNQWLERLFDRMGLTNTTLADIKDILIEFQQTTLDESTDPLPSQGLVDFESSQGSLRNDSDVSSDIDDVFNDADFGSFSNGFNVIWSIVDSVLNTNPIFFSLVILVLTLGLLNLIFNRR